MSRRKREFYSRMVVDGIDFVVEVNHRSGSASVALLDRACPPDWQETHATPKELRAMADQLIGAAEVIEAGPPKT